MRTRIAGAKSLPKTHAEDTSRDLRALFNSGAVAGLGDAELLDRYLAGDGDPAESAFSALVNRHGPMVLRVCHQVLRDPHDAEDAFQATFLVLARKADSVRRRGSIGPYLHGIALRVARTARSAAERRRRHLIGYAERSREPAGASMTDDLGRVLHEELGRLSPRYREVAILCLLEGRAYAEAAALIGCPTGTVMSRLSEARRRLRARLSNRGLMIPLGDVGTLLTGGASPTNVFPSTALSRTTSSAMHFAAGNVGATGATPVAAATLAGKVLKAMLLSKLKWIASATAILGLVVCGAGISARTPVKAGGPTESDRLGKVEAKLDELLKAMGRGKAPDVDPRPRRTNVPEAGGEPGKRLDIAKEPIGPRMLLAVNVNREKKLVIFEEWMIDLSDPSRPKEYVEFGQFSLERGRVYRADGEAIKADKLWAQLPGSPEEKARPVLLSPNLRAILPQFLGVLKEGTLIFVGELEFRGVGLPRADESRFLRIAGPRGEKP